MIVLCNRSLFRYRVIFLLVDRELTESKAFIAFITSLIFIGNADLAIMDCEVRYFSSCR